MHRLGGEPQVPHHGDARTHEAVDHRQGLRFPALQLHGGGGAVLQHLSGGGHGLVHAALVAEERQVRDDQRLLIAGALQPSAHGPGVHHHFLQGDWKRGGMPQHHHGQGIAHQDRVRAGVLHEGRGEGIPGGQDGNGPALLLAREQISRSHLAITGWMGLIASIRPTRTHAARTPKSGQDRKGAATRDALGRRGFRVTPIQRQKKGPTGPLFAALSAGLSCCSGG